MPLRIVKPFMPHGKHVTCEKHLKPTSFNPKPQIGQAHRRFFWLRASVPGSSLLALLVGEMAAKKKA